MKAPHNFDVSIEVNDATGEVLAAYFRIRKGRSAETREFAGGKAFADYDKSGNLLGIELLAPCRASVFNEIAASEPVVKQFLKRSAPRHLIPA